MRLNLKNPERHGVVSALRGRLTVKLKNFS